MNVKYRLLRLSKFLGENGLYKEASALKSLASSVYSEPSKDLIESARNVKNIKWKEPDIEEEIGEIVRTAKEFDVPLDDIIGAVKEAKLEEITDDVWSQLQNTDSYNISVEQALELSKEYNRNISRIYKGIKNGKTLPAPIVLSINDEEFYLIGGNTRLMACASLNKVPKVLMIKI